MLQYSFIAMFITFIFSVLFAFLKKEKLEKLLFLIGFVLSVFNVVYIIYKCGRVPTYGRLETVNHIIFISALIEIFYRKKNISKYLGITYLLLITLVFFEPLKPNDDFFMYANIWVVLFFHLRIVAAGVFLYAMITSFFNFKFAKNFLLLGSLIYLISEFSGSVWCLDWHAESWSWSKGFFKASTVFLLAMLACHIPASLLKYEKLKISLASIPFIFLLFIMLV